MKVPVFHMNKCRSQLLYLAVSLECKHPPGHPFRGRYATSEEFTLDWVQTNHSIFCVSGGMSKSESADRLFLQVLWDWMRERQSLLGSPFFPVFFSLTVYLCCCFPYVCLDLLCPRLALVRRFKIRPHVRVAWDVARGCVRRIVRNHVCFIFPLSVAHRCWRPAVSPPLAPELASAARDVLACLVLFDAQYFFWHLLHHRVPWLYRCLHAEHHLHSANFSLMTEDAGVWETLSLSFFAVLSAALLHCHPLTEMLFFVTNIYLSVEAHSGYEFPWSTHRLVPFDLYGGAQHHDLHHLKVKGNYAPYFTHWDRLFGTLLGQSAQKESGKAEE